LYTVGVAHIPFRKHRRGGFPGELNAESLMLLINSMASALTIEMVGLRERPHLPCSV
jgi:hypothetical protein